MNYYLLRLADTTASVVAADGYWIDDGLLWFDNEYDLVVKGWLTVATIDKETFDKLSGATDQFHADLASAPVGGEA